MAEISENQITAVKVQMYKMGTGDCFVIKFMKGQAAAFKMMIDCGVWQGKYKDIQQIVQALKNEVNNHLDVLAITHEHKDHVYGFQAAEGLFTEDFKADRIWMGWPENDEDPLTADWKKDHGKKRKALALAAEKLKNQVQADENKNQFAGSRHQKALLGLRQQFSLVLHDFAELHLSGSGDEADDLATFSLAGGAFVDSLKGMTVVKEKMANNNITYFQPGDVIEDLPGLDGVRIYVLGPPKSWAEIKKEKGGEGEAYQHNKKLEESDLLVEAVLADEDTQDLLSDTFSPFDESFETSEAIFKDSYLDKAEAWRRIDDDWLFSSGTFALRLTSHINNLSLALAIEFIDSGKVLLFPGDAEIGSWNSWQNIDWSTKGLPTTTEQLLNKVIFYKVAHHLSHNGTAKANGLDMMTHPDLVAMATLDYNVISNGWKSTMPNRQLVKDLLKKTKGRLLIMNDKELFFDLDNQIPLVDKIKEFRAKMSNSERETFNQALQESDFLTEYVIKI